MDCINSALLHCFINMDSICKYWNSVIGNNFKQCICWWQAHTYYGVNKWKFTLKFANWENVFLSKKVWNKNIIHNFVFWNSLAFFSTAAVQCSWYGYPFGGARLGSRLSGKLGCPQVGAWGGAWWWCDELLGGLNAVWVSHKLPHHHTRVLPLPTPPGSIPLHQPPPPQHIPTTQALMHRPMHDPACPSTQAPIWPTKPEPISTTLYCCCTIGCRGVAQLRSQVDPAKV